MRTVKAPIFLLLTLFALSYAMPAMATGETAAEDMPSTPARIDDEDILALNDRLMRMADYYVKPVGSTEGRIDAVIALMFDRDKLGLVYSRDKTSTVEETVAEGGGNCLSLAAVFVALARYVGLDTSFVSVSVPPNWREGEVKDLYVVSQHMSAEVRVKSRVGRKKHAVEFLWVTSLPGDKDRKVISDLRAYADFYSNVAVEFLQQNRLEDALYYAEKATATDPRHSYAWVNLGVIYRKLGRSGEAEQSYLTSLKLEKDNPSALSNLVSLYRLQGRDHDVARYSEKVERYRIKNPYYLHSLAKQAIAERSYEEAIRLLKRAIKKSEYEDRFYFTLAQAYYLHGKHRQAIASLDKARELVSDPAVKARYSKKLDLLQETVTNG